MKKKNTIVIAEAGVNHNGSLILAKKLISAAKNAGADIVKFQTFITDNIIIKSAKKALYQKKYKPKQTQYSMLKDLELSFDDFKILSKICFKKKIEFLSTGFDINSLKFLNSIKQKRFKIPSGEITNYPLLRFIGSKRKEIILSTGMSNLKEIESAIKVMTRNGTPLKKITILHCTSAYPTNTIDVNLKAMISLKNQFGTEVGYSDHTMGIEAPVIAVSLGAKIIEKHLTLSRKFRGPDHRSSIEPNDFKKMVLAIKNTEKYLGSDVKIITKSEKKNRNLVRKSIVAFREIKKGESFSESNLTTKRPGIGISPMKWEEIIGKKAQKNYKKNELI